MGGCLKSVFWLIVIGVCFILCFISNECGRRSFSSQRDEVRELLQNREYKKAADQMHDYFVDEYEAENSSVDSRMGTLADEVIDSCLQAGDIESAKRIYLDYGLALPEYGSDRVFKYMKKHNLAGSADFKPKPNLNLKIHINQKITEKWLKYQE